MSNWSRERPFAIERMGDLQPLREAMIQAGFVDHVIQSILSLANVSDKPDFVMLQRRTEAPSPLNTFFRLFVMGIEVPESAVRSALMSVDVESLIAGGLLLRTEKGIRSLAKLLPHDGLYVAGDFMQRPGEESQPSDLVLGVSPASITLSALTVRRHAARALDLGCGSGIQALFAASHCGHVVGTDINRRALCFAAFNARLNNAVNTEWRAGSFFEPVENDLYDLVVSNPPFVVSPQSQYMYRDAGWGSDKISEYVVRTSAQKLREGGYASILISWYCLEGQSWDVKPRAWFEGNGCDSWLIRCRDQDPLSYASSWLRGTEADRPERYAQLLKEWLEYYAGIGAARICFGAAILRKRSGQSNWVRWDAIESTQGTISCGDHIDRIFAAEDFLHSMADEGQLLAQHLTVHPDVAITQRLSLQDREWRTVSFNIHFTRGLPFSGAADPVLFRLLSQCNGQRPLQDAIRQVAEDLEADFGSLVPACLQTMKRLIRSGMLIPSR